MTRQVGVRINKGGEVRVLKLLQTIREAIGRPYAEVYELLVPADDFDELEFESQTVFADEFDETELECLIEDLGELFDRGANAYELAFHCFVEKNGVYMKPVELTKSMISGEGAMGTIEFMDSEIWVRAIVILMLSTKCIKASCMPVYLLLWFENFLNGAGGWLVQAAKEEEYQSRNYFQEEMGLYYPEGAEEIFDGYE